MTPSAPPAPRLGLVGAGPQRAGTTWLYACLTSHPDLAFPAGVKETFFLDERFEKGWDWYWSHFREAAPGAVRAEIAPTYFDQPQARERLWAHNPECRVVVSLRDPAARSFSLYLHLRSKGRLSGSFEDAVRASPRIVDSSRYARHLSGWIDRFGAERVHVVLADDIAERPEVVWRDVCAFAGLAPRPVPGTAGDRVNSGGLPRFPVLATLATRGGDWLRERRLYGPINFAKRLGLKRLYRGQREVPVLDRAARARLVETFAEDIRWVEGLVGRPLDRWRSFDPGPAGPGE